MKILNKKSVFLGSAVSMLFFCLCIGPVFGYGTSSSPEPLGNTSMTETLTMGDSNAYYSLSANAGDSISIDLTYTESDVDYDIEITLRDPEADDVDSDKDQSSQDGALLITHIAQLSGDYRLRLNADKEYDTLAFTVTVSGLTGVPGLGDTVNYMILGGILIGGIAAIVVLYKRVF